VPVLGQLHFLAGLGQPAAAGLGLGRVVVVRESVEALAKDLPDEQAPPGLELADIPRGVRITPRVVPDRLVPEPGPLVHRQPVVSAGELTMVVGLDPLVVGVQVELARRLLSALCGVAARAAPGQDRLDVPPVLDVQRTGREP
jgi:hypothetical protein